ncbi:MAG TPA: histidine kinase [Amycolatopsis sp.]|uniref:sensor histidine kinase n=1 Tax=Amycolatopsis sp. TaxID=37632 RepID=UPI002B48CD1B|nr:histidine kinase [Amycolatopsis sp.]HKS48663.1 histidine kinase [Amycolatopsis sp.]
MTYEVRRHRFSLGLDSLRWIFVAVPLASMVPRLTAMTWPLEVLALAGSVPMLWLPARPRWTLPAGLLILEVSGCALSVLIPRGLASVIVFTATFYAVRFLSRTQAVVAASVVVSTFVAQFLRSEEPLTSSLLNLALLAAVVLLGISRRDRLARIEQTELALARAQAAVEERAVAAALAERARIARELHDVLAHSLSGLALNLQGARLMLMRDGAGEEVIAQIERARRLAADGLAEARKAVAALRDDPVFLDRAIADQLAAYRLDTGARAELAVLGESREIGVATGSAVLRTVQEALTNTRKHAPDSAVDVTLSFVPGLLEVTVLDHQARPPKDGPPGYGLKGMRERAELLGGRLTTGPGEDGWRVQLTVPA